VAGTELALLPFWSPDSRSIGFLKANRLMRVSVDGSPPEVICDAPAWAGASWSTGDVIVFSRAHEAGFERVAAGGGVPASILEPEAGETMAWPVVLPDGRHFVFHQLGAGDRTGIFAASTEGGVRKLLVPGSGDEFSTIAFAPPDYLLYVRDRALLAHRIDLMRLEMVDEPVRIASDVHSFGPAAAFGVSQTGVLAYWPGNIVNTRLTWVDRRGTVTGTAGPPGSFVHVALDRDGRRAALTGSDRSAGIWVLDLARGSLAAVRRGANLFSPVWAPDGSALAFAEVRDRPPNIYIHRLDAAGDPERITDSSIQHFPLDWSSDGAHLLFLENHPLTRADIWRIPATGNGEPIPVLAGPANEALARIAPDGRWLAYQSNESGRTEIYVTPFPGPGRRWLVSLAGGSEPIWSHDGRELFYVAPDGRLMVVSTGKGGEFAPGVPEALFELNAWRPTAAGAGWGFAVAPDGRVLVNRLVDQHVMPITVVLNWPQAVRAAGMAAPR
jgi:eukaryotic-like serine/threonine-protein kinase